jgi:DNA gyrase/topoisomerase IV subunit A
VVLMLLAAGPVVAGDRRAIIDGVISGLGDGMQNLANSMEARRKEDLARERLRLEQQRVDLEQQRLDQELAYQRAVLEQNQRQFDAQMADQREKRAQFDAARRAAAEADQKARGPVPRNTAELAPNHMISLAEGLVTLCANEVRALTPHSRFDAYLDLQRGATTLGTEEERFKFDKCLWGYIAALQKGTTK